MRIEFSKLQSLNVKFNNEKSRDFTNPNIPSGQEPVASSQHGQQHVESLGQIGHVQPSNHPLLQLQSDYNALLTPPFSPINNQVAGFAGPFTLSPLHAQLSMAHLAQTNQSNVLLVSNLNEQVSIN